MSPWIASSLRCFLEGGGRAFHRLARGGRYPIDRPLEEVHLWISHRRACRNEKPFAADYQHSFFFGLIAAILVLLGAPAFGDEIPGKSWISHPHPESDDWDMAKLKELRRYIIEHSAITGFIIVYRGRVVFEYGDVKENSYIASCRKSLLAMIYGPYVESGVIDLKKTVAQMQMDDVGGLLPVEREATIGDIISARSGIFHPASYSGDYLEFAPQRGSVRPGSYWLYSNWDFNAAGYIFEKETGRNIYDEFQRLIADPIELQDWDRNLQKKEGDLSRSIYPAYPMWLSTRDMARVGLLMLRGGDWGGHKVIDTKWIQEMLTSRTSYLEVNKNIPSYRNAPFGLGYGYMWWLWQNVPDSRLTGGYSALGSMGQSITVFPAIGTVIAYKTKDAYERETPFEARFRVLMKAAACISERRPDPSP